MLFIDRVDAGKRLAAAVERYKDGEVVVYGLPRGGVILAAEVARFLNAPLDILIPRKIGHPMQPEYAIGAVAEDGQVLIGDDRNVDSVWLESEISRQRAEARRRRETYVGNREPILVEGKTAILVDDGIATGLTMKLSILQVRRRNPAKIVVAVPVIPGETYRRLLTEADEVVALEVPESFAGSVGSYYEDFGEVEDEDVVCIMRTVR